MSHDRIADASKKLSWLLRHGASSVGVPMDAAGWVPVSDALRATKISRATLDEVVRLNTKSRLEVSGERIRACQGHSREGTPVTVEALEASWALHAGAAPMFHGTHVKAATSIARAGILPRGRTHVHLAPALSSHVGKRANIDLMLEVCPERVRSEGLVIYQSGNGVLLCRWVPPRAIVGLVALTRAAKEVEAELRAAYGLEPAAGAGPEGAS